MLSQRAREQMQAEIAQRVIKMRRVRQGTGAFKPQGNVLAIMASTEDEVLAEGPAGTGKSRAWLQKLHSLMCDYPGAMGLIIRKTRESVTDTTLVTWEQYVLGEDNPIVGGVRRENRHAYYYPNGSVVNVGGMNKPTRVLSSEYDFIYVPEAIEFEENELEVLSTRLGRRGVLPFDQLAMDTNPDIPTHWLKRRGDEGRCKVIRTTHEDNPTLYDADTGEWTERGRKYLRRLDRLTGVRLQRYRHGAWVGAEGAIYEMWNPGIHLVDHFKPPSSWRFFRVIDFGFVHPFVCQWWAMNPEGDLFLYREIYTTRRLVADLAVEIKELTGDEPIEVTIADHDAEDRATLLNAGIATVLAMKDVSPGLQAVEKRMAIPEDGGRPHIYIMRDCLVKRDESLKEKAKPTCTAEEIPGYVWAKASNGKPAKEVPVKVDDHGVDAMRYMVIHVDGKPSVLFASVPRADVVVRGRNRLEEVYYDDAVGQ